MRFTRTPTARDFNLMVIGQIISLTGAELLRFSLSLYVLDLTGRADIFATLYAVSTIPVVLSPIGGAIADRFSRRNLMVIFDFTSGGIVFSLILLLTSGYAGVPLIGIIMFLLAIISSMYQPTVQASIPLLVAPEKLEGANGIVSGVGSLAGMAAPMLGGILYGVFGLRVLAVTSCLAFLCSAVMELFICIPHTRRAQGKHIIPTIAADLREGIAYVATQSYIRKAMVLAVLVNFAMTPFFTIGAPVILRVTMGSSETMYGVGMGIFQFAMIAGALLMGVVASRLQIRTMYRWILAISLLALPITLSLLPAMLGMGYYPSFVLFFVSASPIAVIITVVSIYLITLVQKRTPGHLLGKVMALTMGVAQCASPVGQFAYGKLYQIFNDRVWVTSLMMGAAVLGMALLAKRMFRNEEEEPQPITAPVIPGRA